MDKKLEHLKQQYLETPIPDELEFIVKNAFKQKINHKSMKNQWLIGAGVAVIIFISLLNTSATIARAMSGLPVVDDIIKILIFREYEYEDDHHQAIIKVPTIRDLAEPSLEEALNKKYLAEGKLLYEELIDSIGQDDLNLATIESDVDVKTDNEKILSLARIVTRTLQSGSSKTEVKFDTIDKKNKIVITLPMLFKNDQYIDVISENIKKQMEEDTQNTYFIEFGDEDAGKAVRNLNQFYINTEGKLVIVFNKYEVAPGYMGLVEFVIPTNVISELLESNEYIQ
ncbi:RsiV family protein [Bacillus sp. 2205SS5-2]|uniref:RsiV family protein n=1 Tax=Bacillus sp. 2205SS5-2 TaxID=3109031 RepID=UPI0030041DFA